MPIIYPEGGMPGLTLRQKQKPLDTFRVQLIPLRAAPKTKIKGPEDVAALVREMEDYDRESARLIHLDTKNQVMGIETISIGSLNASIVHPRETVKGAVLNNSANVIFVHNHPSGVCEPSNEDVDISGRLKEAFNTVGIVLLDSVIVGKGCHYSLKESGFLGDVQNKRFISTSKGISERISDLSKEKRLEIARGIAATTGPAQEPGNYITLDEISKLPAEERKRYLKILAAGGVRESTSKPLQKLKSTYNDFANTESAGLKAKIDKITVCTDKPINESQTIGAAIPMNGHLVGYHLTDNPDEVIHNLGSDDLVVTNPGGDLGGGFYLSSVPEYWRVRSQKKWDFAKNLTQLQRANLVNIILTDPRYKKGGDYLTDYEVDRLVRDLKMYVDSGDVTYLTITGNQPHNVNITEDLTRKAGVPAPKEPGLVEVTLSGKFVDAAGLYTNPLRDEVINRARAWGLMNKPELMGFTLNTKNVVNAYLESIGYSGMFTRSGMTSNPEMVVWDRKAIISYRKVV
ncbi:MAG: JAB domain-containing protein [Desulfocapsaceae bacterium]|nr:JAB domain-containing protein [Desulfocapsaceae bacterium]